MPGKFNYEVRHKYPHLIGEDSEIWSRFVTLYPERFETVSYDIKVGRGAKVFTITDEKSQRYWTNLTKKRIDVLGYSQDVITIIEIKKRVGLYTLGQILGYQFLFLRENPEIKEVKLLIISSSIPIDDVDILNHYKVPFLIV